MDSRAPFEKATGREEARHYKLRSKGRIFLRDKYCMKHRIHIAVDYLSAQILPKDEKGQQPVCACQPLKGVRCSTRNSSINTNFTMGNPELKDKPVSGIFC
jgi:hypothetical protein